MDTPNIKIKEKAVLDKIKRREKKKRVEMKVDGIKVRGLVKMIRDKK